MAAAGSAGQVARAAVLRGMVWMASGGLALATMNALMRVVTQQIEPATAQFLRYAFGLVAFMPIIFRGPIARLRPRRLAGQFWRGLAQTGALALFFLSLPHLPLADVTAILFTTPIFVLMGAALFLGERVSAARWLAAIAGFIGVIVVIWPHFTAASGAGAWSLVMLASSPLFATALLITKALTRFELNDTMVVWQNLVVTLLTLPLALVFWSTPDPTQLLLLAICGLLGSIAHWCFQRAFSLADISAVQPMRFLDLIWSSLLSIALFGTQPALTALAGGAVIVAATIWLARSEARRARITPD